MSKNEDSVYVKLILDCIYTALLFALLFVREKALVEFHRNKTTLEHRERK